MGTAHAYLKDVLSRQHTGIATSRRCCHIVGNRPQRINSFLVRQEGLAGRWNRCFAAVDIYRTQTYISREHPYADGNNAKRIYLRLKRKLNLKKFARSFVLREQNPKRHTAHSTRNNNTESLMSYYIIKMYFRDFPQWMRMGLTRRSKIATSLGDVIGQY
ncbi:MAG: hypothetical protein V4801_00950 [Burkholderia gladioli]